MDTGYSYDSAGRLTGIDHANGATVIDGFTYSLDGNGNRTGVTSNAGSETYTLDALNRLTAVSYPGAVSEAFVYDAAGNRTSHTKTDGTTVGYTVDPTGQLVSDTAGTTYSYDAAGNLTSTSDGETYGYDDYGRHSSITAGGVSQTSDQVVNILDADFSPGGGGLAELVTARVSTIKRQFNANPNSGVDSELEILKRTAG